jgi:hypothetical protein
MLSTSTSEKVLFRVIPPEIPENCTSYEVLHAYMEEYKARTFQELSTDHSKKVETSNKDIKSAIRKRDLSFVYNNLTYHCIHSGPVPSSTESSEAVNSGEADRHNAEPDANNAEADQPDSNSGVENGAPRKRTSYATACPFEMVVNVPFNAKTKKYDGFNLYKFIGVHNHPVNAVIYSQYPNQRKLPKDNPVLTALAQADVNSRKLKEYVHENLGLEVVLRDIYNFKAEVKRESRGGQKIEERVESVLQSLSQGSFTEVLYDDDVCIQGMFIQTPKMKKLLESYSDVLLVDTTYMVCNESYGLLTMMVTDASGHGRPVCFVLLASDKNFPVKVCEICAQKRASKASGKASQTPKKYSNRCDESQNCDEADAEANKSSKTKY